MREGREDTGEKKSQDFGTEGVAGLLQLPSTVADGSWDVRVAIGIAAVWLVVSSIPLFVVVPEAAPDRTRTGARTRGPGAQRAAPGG